MKEVKIVLIENDEDEREFMKLGFDASKKFNVLTIVKNGDLLMQWLSTAKEKPDVILSDLNMPGKNGYDIIQMMKDYNIPVVITSTSTTRSIIDKCLQAGAADYIVKPDTFIEYEEFARRFYDQLMEGQILSGAKH